MIAGLRGHVRSPVADGFILDVHGVYYRLYATPQTTAFASSASSAEIEVITRLILREDDVSLYGFANIEEERIFSLLISVSGVGPKVALGLLARFSPSDLALAVARGDEARLTQASGVGRKLAGRIVLELKDRIAAQAQIEASDTGLASDEALLALLALGLPERDAAAALEGEAGPPEERVRRALAKVGRMRA